MGRTRTVSRRRARGNGCRAVARHLQVAQPRCPFDCRISPPAIFQPHMHNHTDSTSCKIGGPGRGLTWVLSTLAILALGVWVIVLRPSSVSLLASSPFSSEITFCSNASAMSYNAAQCCANELHAGCQVCLVYASSPCPRLYWGWQPSDRGGDVTIHRRRCPWTIRRPNRERLEWGARSGSTPGQPEHHNRRGRCGTAESRW